MLLCISKVSDKKIYQTDLEKKQHFENVTYGYTVLFQKFNIFIENLYLFYLSTCPFV